MLDLLIKSFWLLLPAAFGNMAPVLFKWIPFLNVPVDLNKTFRGKPIFGEHKTYRGFLFGILTAIFIVYLQQIFYTQTQSLTVIDYSQINIFLLGFLMGFGALLGDLIESFFKRQVDIDSGKPWFPFDQIDWVIGSLIVSSLYISHSREIIIISIILLGFLHPLVNLVGYYIGIKSNKF